MDYYSILGVDRNASEQDIRKAYKKQSMQHHPDRGGNEEQFKKINEAYSTLKDPQKRAAYDNPRPQFNFNTSNMEDMFAHAFGQGFARQQRTRNPDITIAVKILLEEVLVGKNLIASYRLRNGSEQSVTIDIPAGAKDGDTIRFQGLGDQIVPGPRGNLFVKIKILPHKEWRRDGTNLYKIAKVNALDMITGGTTVVTTLEGKNFELKIPAGTKNETTFNIPGYGLPSVNTRQRGNLYITISAEIPKVLNEDIIEKLKEIRNEIS